jgi:predicted secreted protein
MAGPSVINGDQILILIGDGASPEVFAHPCLINTDRGFTLASSATQEVVPDCDDPAAPAWVFTEIDGLNAAITGSGVHDVSSTEEYFDWYTSGASKNVKVKQNRVGGSTFTGAFKLTEYSFTGTRKSKATGSISLVSDGPVTRADNA